MKDNIRNFCIIAHIDHGKSTLADRLLELTGTLTGREMKNQTLDDMELEQERGITIKSHAVTMSYKADDGKTYILNLIDTPGHVDFTYEVSRSIAACEGALLVVDASQGIEAQTLSNLYLAMGHDLEIIPVINKIDLPAAQPEHVAKQIKDLIGCIDSEIVFTSAKTGAGVAGLLEKIITVIPPPKGEDEKPLQALIFDSMYDQFRGAVAYIKLVNGTIRQGDKIKMFNQDALLDVEEIGILKLERIKRERLSAGEVGYLITGTKNARDIKVGDTVTYAKNGAEFPLPGYQDIKPMVYSGVFPVSTEDYNDLKDSLEKLKLNDSSLVYTPESSTALGFGFRVGYLGLLHMEIVHERLEREYDMSVINTFPNVTYNVYLSSGEMEVVTNPKDLDMSKNIMRIEEPFINASIITMTEHIGAIMKLSLERRGVYIATDYIDETRVVLKYQFPLSEVIFDFFDKLKSISRGYASFDYEIAGYQATDMIRLDILLNGEKIDALAAIIHRDKSYHYGEKICRKLKEIIPRQMFDCAIQAAICSRIISRSTVKALRKNVLAKCYGGDITRKRKLLEKQKKGKKKMKQIGSVELPQEAFLALLKIDE
ncbi:MAG: translation elongation factor 4 [Candidatus Delongbacteria bacterium]|nr:translation elongation factor 4 [Candidatus Delongbacteria bacterium]MCG2760143.1 translation elongation factor 4 [Candidatus Delongbacteria bacterium]